MKTVDIDSIIGREELIARETQAGRQGLAVYVKALRELTPEGRIARAFRLTEEVKQIAIAGIRSRNPDASEEEVQQIYVNQKLAIHGTSLEEIRQEQKEALDR